MHAMLLTATVSEETNQFLPLLLVLLLAFLVPIALARFQRVPVVVGEIVAGIIIGPSVLGLVGEDLILTFMSDIGLAFLMFLAGMEIDISSLFPTRESRHEGTRLSVLPLAIRVYLVTLALAIVGGQFLNRLGASGDPWLLAFILSATSLGVVLPILKERNLLATQNGQLIFLSATLADFITVILLTIYIITFDRGFDLEILSLGLLFLAFVIFYRVGPGFVRIPAVREFFEDLSRATVQLKVRGAIAILMGFVVLAELVDAELILGAFLAGMIISLLKGPEDEGLVHKLEAFGFGFFIPVFFIMVGVGLDLQSVFDFPEKLLLLPGIFLVALVVKLVPMLTLRRRFPGRHLLASGILLNTHLSLEIAVAVIGLRTGLFDPATSTNIVLFAIITVVTMPILFSALMPHLPSQRRRFTLLVGVNDLGMKVAEELRVHGVTARFLESDAGQRERAQRAGFEVVEASPDVAGLDQVDISQAEAVLTLNDDDALNVSISRKARAMGNQNVVALLQDPSYLPELQEAGVQPFMSAIHRVTMIAMMARNPNTYTLLTSTTDNRDIVEVQLQNRHLTGQPVRRLQLPGDYLVLAIRRDGELLIPHGNTMLEFGDRLTILGDQAGIQDLKNWLEGRSSRLDTRSLKDLGLH